VETLNPLGSDLETTGILVGIVTNRKSLERAIASYEEMGN